MGDPMGPIVETAISSNSGVSDIKFIEHGVAHMPFAANRKGYSAER